MLTMRGWKRQKKLSCFCSCSQSALHFFPWAACSLFAGREPLCSYSFHPQQSLAQAVPLLLHLLKRKKVAYPSGYMLLGRKGCHSSPAPYLSPGRAWSIFSSLQPQKQCTEALLPFSKYSLQKRSEHLKDVSFASLCLIPT